MISVYYPPVLGSAVPRYKLDRLAAALCSALYKVGSAAVHHTIRRRLAVCRDAAPPRTRRAFPSLKPL